MTLKGKIKKRRILSIILTAALAVTLLAGCGGGSQSSTEGGGTASTETATAKTYTPTAVTYTPTLPTESEEADVFVAPIEGLSDDFIKGMDVSSLLAEEKSGVKYYDENGEEQDLFKILADSGINYIRVRVWNDPYDSDGNGYGGGNCDAETAAELGSRAAAYGMKTLVDFHYSDFWADPNKQYAPKAWEDATTEEKADLLYDYTVDALDTILSAGADVGMVQIGNEINTGIASETGTENIMAMLTAASSAVRSVDPDIQIIVHYTNIDNHDDTLQRAGTLEKYDIDYDIFGVSYYPYWHGTMENMESVLADIKSEYGKDTCIVETAYMYTGDDTDGFGNSVSGADALDEYPATVQGQTSCIRDVMAYASEAGALGVFYWEGAWIAADSSTWETEGSGWASSYSADYDPDDAGLYYGGCSWDNQAFFDADGNKLPSLDVFKYVNYGATCPLEVMAYKSTSLEFGLHEELVMPDTVDAVYNDPSVTDGAPVTWDADEVAAVDVNVAGEYTIHGTTEDGTEVTASVKYSNINYVQNPSFEDEDTSMWAVTVTSGGDGCTDYQNKASDANTGDISLHFWSDSDIEFEAEQTITGFPAGTYTAKAQLQGGDISDDEIYLYVDVDGTRYESDPITLTGWVEWKTGEVDGLVLDGSETVTVGVHVKCAANGWGTIDDFEFSALE